MERYLRSMEPSLEIQYASDEKNMPYGEKSGSEILRLTKQLIGAHKGEYDVLVPACNTMSVALLGAGLTGPRVVDIITPTIRVLSRQHLRNLGVISTYYTHRSRMYSKSLHALSMPSSSLAKLIEEGDKEKIQVELQAIIEPLKRRRVKRLILGCTHYELVDYMIREMYPHLELLYPGKYQAEAVMRRVQYPARYGLEPPRLFSK
ncbi:MAG: aspartate/glutamate racemase family protein [Tissierellia bacterium]|nr:aspartate/glutamate racemase family protein [Tissierellia bacterium]